MLRTMAFTCLLWGLSLNWVWGQATSEPVKANTASVPDIVIDIAGEWKSKIPLRGNAIKSGMFWLDAGVDPEPYNEILNKLSIEQSNKRTEYLNTHFPTIAKQIAPWLKRKDFPEDRQFYRTVLALSDWVPIPDFNVVKPCVDWTQFGSVDTNKTHKQIASFYRWLTFALTIYDRKINQIYGYKKPESAFRENKTQILSWMQIQEFSLKILQHTCGVHFRQNPIYKRLLASRWGYFADLKIYKKEQALLKEHPELRAFKDSVTNLEKTIKSFEEMLSQWTPIYWVEKGVPRWKEMTIAHSDAIIQLKTQMDFYYRDTTEALNRVIRKIPQEQFQADIEAQWNDAVRILHAKFNATNSRLSYFIKSMSDYISALANENHQLKQRAQQLQQELQKSKSIFGILKAVAVKLVPMVFKLFL